MKIEDLKDVINEAPLPEHLVLEMRLQNQLQQKKENEEQIVSEQNTPQKKPIEQQVAYHCSNIKECKI